MLDMPAEEFEDLVESALATIPEEFVRAIDNVAFFVEDESSAAAADGVELFGLYEGVPLTQRGHWYAGVQPDRITIYRLPILRHCWSRWEVVDQIAKTVVHEVGHYFGISDRRLRELGY
jgi:predicted Zn-dependent protease with MMP-like domain